MTLEIYIFALQSCQQCIISTYDLECILDVLFLEALYLFKSFYSQLIIYLSKCKALLTHTLEIKGICILV